MADELEVIEENPGAINLFGAGTPAQVIQRATEVADVLKDVLQRQGMTSNIQGRQYVRVEGWQTLGSMLGVSGVCVWTRPVGDAGNPEGWEARVEARTMDGRTIGGAEAMCTKAENRWRTADDYAIRSMAQTRATSKALGSVLRFIVTLAGYDGTPAEEMHDVPTTPVSQQKRQTSNRGEAISASEPLPTQPLASAAQQRMIWARCREKGFDDDTVREIFQEVAGVSHTDRIPAGAVDPLLETIDSLAAVPANGD